MAERGDDSEREMSDSSNAKQPRRVDCYDG